jgi:hypothetical protein
MKDVNEFEDECEIDDVPVSPLFSEERRSRYGSVPGLDDEELADPCELEHQIMLQDWGPILALRPTRDDFFLHGQWENGVDASAFNTHDFVRKHGEFDRYRYALSHAHRELREATWMFEGLIDRVKSPHKYLVLEYLQRGIINSSHCVGDMQGVAVWDARIKSVQDKIRRIKDARDRR